MFVFLFNNIGSQCVCYGFPKQYAGISLGMRPANERCRYIVTLHCNNISHWPGTYQDWSPNLLIRCLWLLEVQSACWSMRNSRHVCACLAPLEIRSEACSSSWCVIRHQNSHQLMAIDEGLPGGWPAGNHNQATRALIQYTVKPLI